jgi:hypothetical protein
VAAVTCISLFVKMGRCEERKCEGEEGWKRKGIRQFLNPLMFVGCHVTDKHKRTAPRVSYPLMFVGSATSLTNIRT